MMATTNPTFDGGEDDDAPGITDHPFLPTDDGPEPACQTCLDECGCTAMRDDHTTLEASR